MASSLLIDESPLQVLPTLATAVGLNEAIILQQIHYWVRLYQKANDAHHYHEGKWWVYNTSEEWQKNFPFWSERTVIRALDVLRRPYANQGKDDPCPSRGPLAITGNFNRQGYDRTLWYRIDYDELDKLTEAIMTKCHDGPCQGVMMDDDNMASPIPETTQETNTENTKEKSPANAGESEQWPTDSHLVGETETPQQKGPSILTYGDPIGMGLECLRRTGGKPSSTIPADAGGADPWADKPVTALMGLASIAELPPKKRRDWARKLRELAAAWDATPEQAARAITAIRKDDEHAWRSIASPYEKQFAGVFDVMLSRVVSGHGGGRVIAIGR